MTALVAMTAFVGLVLGAGLWLVLIRMPFMRAIPFAERIEPQLKSQYVESRLLASPSEIAPFGPLERILRPVLQDGCRYLARFSFDITALNKRLSRAGSGKAALDFRAEQLLWAAGGFVCGLFVVIFSAAAGRFSPFPAVAAVLASAIGAFLARDYLLGVQIKRRERRMLAEFPALAELMALAVGAGESPVGALDRVCATARGELAKEFALVLAATRSGKSLVEALQDFSRRTDLGPLVRFVDGVVVAVERGTPLADVLRAQASDVRDSAKRELMESAGRKEIGMMVPLVFGVLPLTVIFAIYPGLAVLDLGF
ncbi:MULTISPECIES: type II secretion system F family protein [Arthrobacter]|uniref:Type II secretion system protein F n=1 Tax=Arthrobacter terricola TaxID=2547396 RepID=A0A4R5KMR4_9MICC|nr:MULTISPECIES: type II secretion system F family protein [Arthrobacter]MBT8161052.1 type II secretion system F family protein [Arthrobacter sp. GN70]TDF96911.1 type II secretion system protein F [Arthrobacter terricola]